MKGCAALRFSSRGLAELAFARDYVVALNLLMAIGLSGKPRNANSGRISHSLNPLWIGPVSALIHQSSVFCLL
jgi:hypothetical protein